MTDYTCPNCKFTTDVSLFMAEEKCLVCEKPFDSMSYFYKKQLEYHTIKIDDVIKLLEQSLGYHCDKPNCDHNLKEAIKVLKRLKGKI